jgi:hypothetical protein
VPLVAVTLLLLSLACAAPGSRSSSGARAAPDTVPGTVREIAGVIRFYPLEGGFYAIRGDDGETYNPTNLPEEFRQDGVSVVATVRLRPDLMGIHQVGPLVEVLEIRRK